MANQRLVHLIAERRGRLRQGDRSHRERQAEPRQPAWDGSPPPPRRRLHRARLPPMLRPRHGRDETGSGAELGWSRRSARHPGMFPSIAPSPDVRGLQSRECTPDVAGASRGRTARNSGGELPGIRKIVGRCRGRERPMPLKHDRTPYGARESACRSTVITVRQWRSVCRTGTRPNGHPGACSGRSRGRRRRRPRQRYPTSSLRRRRAPLGSRLPGRSARYRSLAGGAGRAAPPRRETPAGGPSGRTARRESRLRPCSSHVEMTSRFGDRTSGTGAAAAQAPLGLQPIATTVAEPETECGAQGHSHFLAEVFSLHRTQQAASARMRALACPDGHLRRLAAPRL